MILSVMFGFISPLLFGYALYISLFNRRGFIEMICFSFGFGFGIINIIMMSENYYVGIKFSFFNSLFIATALLGSSIPLMWLKRKRVIEDLKSTKKQFFLLITYNYDSFEIISIGLICILFAIIVYKAVFFPVYYCDAVSVHANIPKQIFMSKTLPTQIGSFTDNFNASPSLFYTQTAWFYLLNNEFNDLFLRILIPIYSILTVLLTYDFGKRLIKRTYGGIISVFFLLSITRFTFLSIVAMVDVPVTFYSLLSTSFFLKFKQTKNELYLFSSGIMIGFGALTKYSAFLFAFVLVIILIGNFWGSNFHKWINHLKYSHIQSPMSPKTSILTPKKSGNFFEWSRFRGITYFLFPFTVIILPFLIRNFMLFGDPLYPLLFGPKNQSDITLGANFLSFEYLLTVIYTLSHVFEALGIFLLTLFFSSFVKVRQTDIISRILILIVVIFSVCVLIIFNPIQWKGRFFVRYVFPVLPLISIISAQRFLQILEQNTICKKELIIIFGVISVNIILWGILETLANYNLQAYLSLPYIISIICIIIFFLLQIFHKNKPNSRSQKLGIAILMILLIVSPIYTGSIAKYRLVDYQYPYLKWDHPSKEEFLEEKFDGLYIMQRWINKNLPPDAKILSYTTKKYYFNREIISCDSYMLDSLYKATNLTQALSILEKLKITYFLYLPPNGQPGSNQIMNSIIWKNINNEDVFHLIYMVNDILLYKIEVERPL